MLFVDGPCRRWRRCTNIPLQQIATSIRSNFRHISRTVPRIPTPGDMTAYFRRTTTTWYVENAYLRLSNMVHHYIEDGKFMKCTATRHCPELCTVHAPKDSCRFIQRSQHLLNVIILYLSRDIPLRCLCPLVDSKLCDPLHTHKQSCQNVNKAQRLHANGRFRVSLLTVGRPPYRCIRPVPFPNILSSRMAEKSVEMNDDKEDADA